MYKIYINSSLFKQECMPVGCVPPAAVAVRGGLHQAPPRIRHPPGDQALPTVDRHTPVNILPCPKLRLRAVKIGGHLVPFCWATGTLVSKA